MSTPAQKAKATKDRKRREEEKRRQEAERADYLLGLMAQRNAFDTLDSELAGLYDEMDKLAKKAPNEPVTDLQLRIVNNFIKKAKYLLNGDTIIDEVEVFVSAGDNPQYRDFVTVLRQIRQGLERFKKSNFIFTRSFSDEISTWDFDEEPGDFFKGMRSQNGAAE
jgi:poly-D-alanine transfer protein DltD